MKCKYCMNNLTENDFYSYKKYKCKKCLIKDSARWISKYPENKKKYRERHKEKQAQYYKGWYEKNGRKRAENYKDVIYLWQKNNPEKIKVRLIVLKAIKRNKIKRPDICSACGEERKTVAHHKDYNYPFKITWLCYSCHKIIHNLEVFS